MFTEDSRLTNNKKKIAKINVIQYHIRKYYGVPGKKNINGNPKLTI